MKKDIPFVIGKKEITIIHIASAAFVAAGIILLSWFFVQAHYQSSYFGGDSEIVSEQARVMCAPRLIDGRCVSPGEENPKLVAVMIENHLDARPQSGLSKASVVYEAPVEANYSRFMALFPIDTVVSKVGPVRSARPYFLDWLREFGVPMYMHVGGSPDALESLYWGMKDGVYFDFNEFYKGDYFWRSTDRYAPHNTYTSSEQWTQGWQDFGEKYHTDLIESWNYTEVVPCSAGCVTSIIVSFLPPVYEAEWRYVTSTEKYMRYQLKKSHVDQDGTQISADTIVVQRVETRVLDSELRIEMDTIGEGHATAFAKGNMVEGTWKKSSRESKTRFYDKTGVEIPFTSGKIWIEVVNQVGGVEYK